MLWGKKGGPSALVSALVYIWRKWWHSSTWIGTCFGQRQMDRSRTLFSCLDVGCVSVLRGSSQIPITHDYSIYPGFFLRIVSFCSHVHALAILLCSYVSGTGAFISQGLAWSYQVIDHEHPWAVNFLAQHIRSECFSDSKLLVIPKFCRKSIWDEGLVEMLAHGRFLRPM